MEFSIEYKKDNKKVVETIDKSSDFILKLLEITKDDNKIIFQILLDGIPIWYGEASGDKGLISILNSTGVFPVNPEMIQNIRKIPKFLLKMMLKYVDDTIKNEENGTKNT